MRSRCSGHRASSTRSVPRSSSTRRRRRERASRACWSPAEAPSSRASSICLRQRIPVQVEPGQVFQHARSQLSLSEEALAEAEPVLAVAVGLAIPGRTREPGQPPSPRHPAGAALPPADLARVRWRGIVLIVLVFGFYLLQANKLGGVNDDIEAQKPTNASIQARSPRSRSSPTCRRRPRRSNSCCRGVRRRGVVLGAPDGLLAGDPVRCLPRHVLRCRSPSPRRRPTAAPVEGAVTGLIGTITAAAQAVSIDTLSVFLTRLEQVKGWVNPWIATVSRTRSSTATTTR